MAECINENLIGSVEEVKDIPVSIDTLFNNYERAYYNKKMDVFIGDIFMKYVKELKWTVNDLKNINNIKRVYNGLKGYIENILIDAANNEGEYNQISDKAYADLEKIYDNFEVFTKQHLLYNNLVDNKDIELFEEQEDEGDISSIEGEEIDPIDVPAEELQSKEDFGDIQKSNLELASSDTKVLFRLIPKATIDSEGNVTKLLDSNGLPSPIDMMQIWNLLSDKISYEKNSTDFFLKLTNKELQRIIPETHFISEILNIDIINGDLSMSQITQLINFYQTFSKPKIKIKSAFISNESVFSLNDEILGNVLKIEKGFKSNFINAEVPEQYQSLVKLTNTGRRYLQGIDSIPTILQEGTEEEIHESEKAFLEFLGIKFSSSDFYNEKENEIFTKLVSETAARFYNVLSTKLKDGEPIYDPYAVITKKVKGSFSEKESLKKLIEWESTFSKITPSLSSRNTMGELQYLINQDSQISQIVYYLNSVSTLKQLMETPGFKNAKYNPVFRNSRVINLLFDEKGNKRNNAKITIDLISGFKKQRINGSTSAKLLRKLSDRDKFILDFQSFIMNGKTDVMRTETSHSFYSFGMEMEGSPMRFVGLNGFDNNFFSNKSFEKQILSYLAAEIERIQSYPKKKDKNPSLTSNYGEFSLFDFLTPELKQKLKDKDPKNIDTDPIKNEVISQFENKLASKLEYLEKDIIEKQNIQDSEYLSKNITDKGISKKGLLRSFIAGTLIQNVEFATLFSGDALFYNDMHKRLKGLSSTGNTIAEFPFLEKYFNSQQYLETEFKNTLAGVSGKVRKSNYSNFNSAVLKDKKGVKQDKRKKNNKPFDYLRPSLINDMRDSVLIRDGQQSKGYNDESLRESLKNNDDVKLADGQGWGNIDFLKEALIRSGYWQDDMQAAYDFEVLEFKAYIKGDELTKDEKLKYNTLYNKIMEEPNRYALPVLKMTYWGNIENSNVDAKVYDKFSIAPMMPSIAKNHPEMKKILLGMVNKNIGYIKYKSGTKAYTQNVYDNIDEVSIPDELSTELLKLQIKPSSEQKIDTSIPTQMIKLIFSNLFDAGKPKTAAAKRLYQEYVEIFKDIQSLQKDKTYRDFGIEVDEETQEININKEVFKEKLLEQARKQGYNSNIISAIKEGDILEATGYLKEINNLIAGILDKNLRRFKFKGGDFILVTNAEMSALDWYKFSRDGVEACGCRITMTKEHSKILNRIHPDGTPIKTIERLNALLKDREWRMKYKDELTIVLDRVPTQGPNSMDVAIVQEFFYPTIGNVVVLPDEIVFKSGTDFDYDKEKVLLPNLSKSGFIIKDLNKVDEKITKLKEERKGIIDNFYQSKNPNKTIQDIRNYIKDIYKILESGQFDKIKKSDRISNDELQELESTFTKIINLEITRDAINKELEVLINEESLTKEIPPAFLEEFMSNQLTDLREELDNTIEEYYKQLNNIKRNEVFNTINEGYKFRNKILNLLEMKGLYFEESANRLLNVYKETLLLPEMYIELITPNSTKSIQPIARESGENTKYDLSLPSGSEVYYYDSNLKVFKTFFDAKTLLGPFAVDNTFHQMLTHLGIDINRQYNYWGNKEQINNLLLSQEEFKKIANSDKILLSLKNDIEGYVKQHWNSEAINATVDAAKDPFFSLMRILWENIGVVNFMKNQGIPFERIVDFINHPALLEYYSYRQNGMNKQQAWREIGEKRMGLSYTTEKPLPDNLTQQRAQQYLDKSREELIKEGMITPNQTVVRVEKNELGSYNVIVKEYVKFASIVKNQEGKGSDSYNYMSTLFKLIDGKDINRIKKYVKNTKGEDVPVRFIDYIPKPIRDKVENNVVIRELTPDKLKNLAKPENDRVKNRDKFKQEELQALYSYEWQVLAHFFQMDKHNNIFRKFQRYYNFDTTKISTLIEINRKSKLKRELEEDGLFDGNDLISMEESSAISSFINLDLQKQIFEQLFPFIAEQNTQNALTNLYGEYVDNFNIFKSPKDLRNLPTIIYTDFISSILFNYGEYKAQNVFDKGAKLLINNAEQQTLSKRFANLRKREEYKELLKDFPILDGFVDNVTIIGGETDANGVNTVSELHSIELKIKSGNETLLEQEEYIEQLRKLFNYVHPNSEFNESLHSFIEDLFIVGLTQSGLGKSATNFSEFIPYEFKQVILKDAFEKFKNLNAKELNKYLSDFQVRFKINNPKFYPFTSQVRIDELLGDAIETIEMKNNINYSHKIKFLRWGTKPNFEIERGRWVKYKGEQYSVLNINGNTAEIFSVDKGKINVPVNELQGLLYKNVFVNYSNFEFMVTPKNTIIIMKTGKVADYAENSKPRIEILKLADAQRNTPQVKQEVTTEKLVETKPSTETINNQREYTPENITSLKSNEVFVFGSNTEGKHGKGAAKTAVDKFGAKYGQAEGLQGQSYAIITKDLAKGKRSVTLDIIGEQFADLFEFAANNPNKKFYVTKLGTDLAGYTVDEIKSEIKSVNDINGGNFIPDNIILPKEFEVRDKLSNQSNTEDTINYNGNSITKKTKC